MAEYIHLGTAVYPGLKHRIRQPGFHIINLRNQPPQPNTPSYPTPQPPEKARAYSSKSRPACSGTRPGLGPCAASGRGKASGWRALFCARARRGAAEQQQLPHPPGP